MLAAGTGRWDFGQNPNGGLLYTSRSSGGYNWTYAATRPNFLSLASSSDGSKLASAMGYGGLHTSTDGGASWTKTSAPDGYVDGCVRHHWQAIASSSDGTKLAAATGYNGGCGSYGTIYTSTDSGVSWVPAATTPWTSRTDNNRCPDFSSIASSSDGSKLAAAAGFGNSPSPRGIYVSAGRGNNGGVSWIKTSAPALDWRSIASSSDGSKLAAVARASGIYTSTDSGATWYPTPASRIIFWRSIASSSDGLQLAAAACDDGSGVYASADGGVSWAKTSAPSSACVIASSSDGIKLVSAGVGGIYTSNDNGGHWNRVL